VALTSGGRYVVPFSWVVWLLCARRPGLSTKPRHDPGRRAAGRIPRLLPKLYLANLLGLSWGRRLYDLDLLVSLLASWNDQVIRVLQGPISGGNTPRAELGALKGKRTRVVSKLLLRQPALRSVEAKAIIYRNNTAAKLDSRGHSRPHT
jgi:hypothetical protein